MSISLFCSFTSLLRLLSNDEVSSPDLDSALFAFGCTRSHVFDNQAQDTEVVFFAEKKSEQILLIQKVRTAVLQAEKDNRAVWRTLEERGMSYEKISTLLESQGLKPLAISNSDYSYNALSLKMKDTNPGVLVRF